MKKKLLTIFMGFSFLFFYRFSAQAQTFSGTSVFDTLENVRDNISIPELTPDENRVIAEQAQILINDLYVNRQAKQDFYNGEVPDPVPLINELGASVDSMTTNEVVRRVYEIFVSQRDLHLNYIFPEPHAFFTSFLPLTFSRTADRTSDVNVRVSAVNAEMFAEFAPGQRVPEIGDLVVGYDGLSIKDAIERQMVTAQGANRYGGINRALGQMTFIPHIVHFPPENNEITITFQEGGRRLDTFGEPEGPEYSITMPWLTAFSSLIDIDSLDGSTPDGANTTGEKTAEDLTKEIVSVSSDIWERRCRSFQKEMKLEAAQFPALPTAAENLQWGIIDNKFGKFAYLRLEQFSSGDIVLIEIRRLISEEFRDTDGLIFDIRNNPGGSILLADNLSQLFTGTRVNIGRARALNNPLNGQIFNDNADLFGEQWVRAFERGVERGRDFTGTTFIGSRSDANAIGKAYFAPVAVFNNARSFSAADLFTCSMRDNRAALVFGEDPLTGAGGANVITHRLFRLLAPSAFEALPRGHEMRASWRQIIRFGRGRGEILEDNGCGLADLRVDLSRNDLINNNADQIKRMTAVLGKLSRAPKFTPAGQTEGFQVERVLFSNNPNPQITFDVTDTDFIKPIRFRQRLERIDAFVKRRETREIAIDLIPPRFKGRVPYQFIGQDLIGRPLWNTRRNYTLIGNKFTVNQEGLDLRFGLNSENDRTLAIINNEGANDDEGWILSDQGLEFQAVNSINRSDFFELESSAYIGLDLSNVTNAELEVEYEIIAPNFDTTVVLLITLIQGDGIEQTIGADFLDFLFFDTPLTTAKFDISQAAGQDTVLIDLRASGSIPAFGEDVIRVRSLRVISK